MLPEDALHLLLLSLKKKNRLYEHMQKLLNIKEHHIHSSGS